MFIELMIFIFFDFSTLLIQFPFFNQFYFEGIIFFSGGLPFAGGDQAAQTVFYIIGPGFPAYLKTFILRYQTFMGKRGSCLTIFLRNIKNDFCADPFVFVVCE